MNVSKRDTVSDTISKCLHWVHRSGDLGSSWQGSNGNQWPEVEPSYRHSGAATHVGTKAEISTQWGCPVTEVGVLVVSVYKLVQEVTKRRDFSVG